MRIVLGGLLVGLAMTVFVASVKAAELKRSLSNEPVSEQPAVGITSEARETSSGEWSLIPEEKIRFHEGAFVYIPPPTPIPLAPVFHHEIYKFVASEGSRKGRLIADQMYGLVPLTTPGIRQATATPVPSPSSSETSGAPDASPSTVTHTLVAPAAAATPLPTPTTIQTVSAAGLAAGVEDPRFYRGSFLYDAELNRLLPIEMTRCCLAAGAAANGVGGTPAAQSSNLAQALSLGQVTASALPVHGKAMYYNPGIMDQVLEYRLELGQIAPCPQCVGYVALLNAGDLNRKVWIEWEEGDVEGPFLVIDVAATQHVPLLLARQWVVDVDYATALRRAMDGPVYVRVLDAPPRPSPMGPFDFPLAANRQRFGP